jgi:hypothetical protein
MSADERRQLAAAGRAYDIRQRPATFPSLDARIAYHHQRLLEIIAMNEFNSTEAQQDTHEKQWDAAAAVQQAPTHQRECGSMASCCCGVVSHAFLWGGNSISPLPDA